MKKTCRCGRVQPCPKHPGRPRSGWAPRDRSAQRRFREALIDAFGKQCQAWEHGRRCPRTDVRACHIIPVAENGGYEISNGMLLCPVHDRATDRYAH